MTDNAGALQEGLLAANAEWISKTSGLMIEAAVADGVVGEANQTTVTFITASAAALAAFSVLRTLLPSDAAAKEVLKEIVDGIQYEIRLARTS